MFTLGEATLLGEKLGIKWETSPFKPKELLEGLKVELEHRDITDQDPILTAKIALTHLKERPDYYEKLEVMEKSKLSKKYMSYDSPALNEAKKLRGSE